MEIAVTRTDRSVVVIVDGEITLDEWVAVCDQYDLRGQHVRVDDYTTEGDRHSWWFTLLPHREQVEVSK
jgi:hypothetical protein